MTSFWTREKHTVLITGGGSGIGLELAKRLVRDGHTVIINGRNQSRLDNAKTEVPLLHVIQGDVETDEGRTELYNKVVTEFPGVDALFNNAGVANQYAPFRDAANGRQDLWERHKQEVNVNLLAPMHLSFLFIPHFLTKSSAFICNVTSGLAFIPLCQSATYSATKAAAHSFTQSLRFQLKDTPIKVVEIIPPAVDTGFAGKHYGYPLEEYIGDTYNKLISSDDNDEITYKSSEDYRVATFEQKKEYFDAIQSTSPN